VPLVATASSGLPIEFSVVVGQRSPPPGCTVTGSTATIISVNWCEIAATQGGNNVYGPASATQWCQGTN
jgi:hypothetical protein